MSLHPQANIVCGERDGNKAFYMMHKKKRMIYPYIE